MRRRHPRKAVSGGVGRPALDEEETLKRSETGGCLVLDGPIGRQQMATETREDGTFT